MSQTEVIVNFSAAQTEVGTAFQPNKFKKFSAILTMRFCQINLLKICFPLS